MEARGAVVAEDGGHFGEDGLCEQLLLLLGGASGEGAGGVAVGRRSVGGRQVRLGIGEFADERAVPGRGVGGDEAFPVDVGDGDGRVAPVQGLLERGDGQFGPHRADAAPCEVRRHVAVGHASVGPGAPGHRGGGEAAGTPVLGQRVEVRVGGGVSALPPASPHPGDGGEQHEGVQFPVAEERVEMIRPVRLGSEHVREFLPGQLLHGGEVGDARRVDDAAERTASGQRVEQGRHGVPVGDVAGDDGDLGAEGGELGGEFGRAGRLGAAPAGEYEVLGAVAGQPACDVRAESAGTAGDQDRAAGPPLLGGGRGADRGGSGEAAQEGSGGADGTLVLAVLSGQDRGEPGGDPVVGALGREVDQAAPERGVLQAEDPAEAPDPGEGGVGDPLVGGDGDGAASDAPQGGVEPGGGVGLEQGQRVGDDVGAEGEHSGHAVRCGLAKLRGQVLVERRAEFDDVGAEGAQGVEQSRLGRGIRSGFR